MRLLGYDNLTCSTERTYCRNVQIFILPLFCFIVIVLHSSVVCVYMPLLSSLCTLLLTCLTNRVSLYLYSTILQHPVALCRSGFFTFAVRVQLRLVLTLLLFTAYIHHILRLNWSSSGVQVVVLKESAVLIFYYNCH
jgi:hypothetical protein